VQLFDAAKRLHWGDAARQRIQERYSNPRVVEKQMEAYVQAVEERRRKR